MTNSSRWTRCSSTDGSLRPLPRDVVAVREARLDLEPVAQRVTAGELVQQRHKHPIPPPLPGVDELMPQHARAVVVGSEVAGADANAATRERPRGHAGKDIQHRVVGASMLPHPAGAPQEPPDEADGGSDDGADARNRGVQQRKPAIQHPTSRDGSLRASLPPRWRGWNRGHATAPTRRRIVGMSSIAASADAGENSAIVAPARGKRSRRARTAAMTSLAVGPNGTGKDTPVMTEGSRTSRSM